MSVSVIIPAFNEEESIGKVIADIPKACVQEIVVVDNGCLDRTAEVARAAGARVVREERRGYGFCVSRWDRCAKRTRNCGLPRWRL